MSQAKQQLNIFQRVAMKRLMIPEAEVQTRSPQLLKLAKIPASQERERIDSLLAKINQEAQNVTENGISPLEFVYFNRDPELQNLVREELTEVSPTRAAVTSVIGSPLQFFQAKHQSASHTHERIMSNALRLQQWQQNQLAYAEEEKKRQYEFLDAHKQKENENIAEQAKKREALRQRQRQVMQNYTRNIEMAQDSMRQASQEQINKTVQRSEQCYQKKVQRAKEIERKYNDNLTKTLERKEQIMAEERQRKLDSMSRQVTVTRPTTNYQKLQELDNKLKDAQNKAEERYNKKMSNRINYLNTYRGNYEAKRQERLKEEEQTRERKTQERNTRVTTVRQRNYQVEQALISRMDNYQDQTLQHVNRANQMKQQHIDHINDVSRQKELNIELARQRKRELQELKDMRARETLAKVSLKHDQVEQYQLMKQAHNNRNVQLETFLESVPDKQVRKELLEAYKQGVDIVGQSLIGPKAQRDSGQQEIMRRIREQRSQHDQSRQQAQEAVRKMAQV